ncbi:MAG: dihydroorotate dehydrogenase [Candidatus Omnitrophica bacterium]|nr:dihydroorotate dehydrogenase [Candidatus Omnitrophota bacterium]MDD5552449.1 dihydroorotate dehydrogenase [Candidatus Omnitrophota bacterium]
MRKKEARLAVNIGKLKLKNPVMVASGTFGYAEEFADFMNLKQLGAVVTKTITLKPRQGNPPPRTCETPAGMLNSIGLENPGVDAFISKKLPILKKIGAPVIVSIASEGDPDEFISLAKRLDKINGAAAIELNISCPNIRGKTSLISQDPGSTFKVVKMVREVTGKTLITKLSPNVTDITEIAAAAEKAGSDAVSLINTLTGTSIDTDTKRPRIASVIAGLSGPAIRPVAVRMIWEVSRKIKIPIIGMGGIMDTPSALEFFIAGASAISTGTANFINPALSVEIISGLKKYLARNKLRDIKELVGTLKS